MRLFAPIFVASSILFAATSAAAQGLCVECRAPERSYACTIKDSEKVAGVRGSGRAQEFLCISEIARLGGHQSCRINTSYSGPCMGEAMELDIAKIGRDAVVIGKPAPDGVPGSEAGAAAGAVPEGVGSERQAKPAHVKKGPPQTLEELARQTVAKSKEQIGAADDGVKKAGDAVGGAVKKTWDCVTSLFKRC